jgi:alpha-tubulin suppressor-like RCC1 family protein
MSERMENVSVWILLSLLLWIAASPAMAAPPVDKPCRGKKCVTPTPTPTPPQVRKVVGGESFTCVLNAGAVKCMGNFEGETNRGAFSNILVPSVVSGLESGVTDISAGPYNLLAIKDGNLYAIGSNDYNQLAQGASYPRDVTSPVLLLSGVKKAAISYYHGCALMQNGEVRCWGSNFYGIFGNGSWSDIPSIADAAIVVMNAQDVFVNENATCVLAGQSV